MAGRLRASRDWLTPRLADAPIVHAHMFGAWWAAGRAMPAGVPLVASEHNDLTWPAGGAAGRVAPRPGGASTACTRTVPARACDPGRRARPARIRGRGSRPSPTSTDARWRAWPTPGSCSPGACIRRRVLTCCSMRWRCCRTRRRRCCSGRARCARRSLRQIRRLRLGRAGAPVRLARTGRADDRRRCGARRALARRVLVADGGARDGPRGAGDRHGRRRPARSRSRRAAASSSAARIPQALAAAIDDCARERRRTDLRGCTPLRAAVRDRTGRRRVRGAYAELAGSSRMTSATRGRCPHELRTGDGRVDPARPSRAAGCSPRYSTRWRLPAVELGRDARLRPRDDLQRDRAGRPPPRRRAGRGRQHLLLARLLRERGEGARSTRSSTMRTGRRG